MATPQRATGANAKYRFQFETTPGVRATGNWIQGAFYEHGLSEAQPLIENPLLGQGRDPLAQDDGAIDVTGPIIVPVDERLIGYHLKGLLGPRQAAATVGARGYIHFNANPTNTDTITLNGATWTFVTSGATGNETNIGADLQATLTQLVTDLQGSADTNIDDATYSQNGDRLLIDHDTADASGNAYTLAQALTVAAKLSGATLAGGGLIEHTFHSGVATLPSMSKELQLTDLQASENPFIIHQKVRYNSMEIGRERAGSARATLNLIAQQEFQEQATAAGTPSTPTVDIFSQFQGIILVDGTLGGNIVGGGLTLSNNLDVVEALDNDGLIEDADPGQTSINLSFTARLSENALRIASRARSLVDVRYGFRNATNGAELEIRLHQIKLPQPSRQISGPGGIDVTYDGLGQQDQSLGRAVTVRLWNDQAAGTYA